VVIISVVAYLQAALLLWLRAKAVSGDTTDEEKAATLLTVNSADAKEAGRRKRATIVVVVWLVHEAMGGWRERIW
jgi:hypothetical protein